MPIAAAAGVPEIVAVPFPLSLNVTPDGRAPATLRVVLVGKPAVVVMVNDPFWPAVSVALPTLVNVGDSITVNVNDCVELSAWALVPLLAVRVNTYVPAEPAVGMPDSTADPLPWSRNVTPGGRPPVSLRFVIAGNPKFDVTRKELN